MSSAQGRFSSPDSYDIVLEMRKGADQAEQRQILNDYLSNPQEWNKYIYALNNPLKNLDPDGRNACGTNDDSTCKVTVTIQDRPKDQNGNYNDQFAGTKGNQNFNATATVTVNGQVVGTFLVRTVPSGSQFATIENGTYQGVLHYQRGDPSKPTIELTDSGSLRVPTVEPNTAQGGEFFATEVLIHSAGRVTGRDPLGYTGLMGNRGVSEGCQLVCSPQYPAFLRATGLKPGDSSPPQRHFTVTIDTSANQ
jgi:hypothetical protein